MRGCLAALIGFFLIFMFGGIIVVVLGATLYVLELLLPILIIVGIVVLIIKLIKGDDLNIFSSKDKRHRYRRRK